MTRIIAIVWGLSLLAARAVRADCDQSPPRPAQVDVYECNNLDTMGHDTALENHAEGKGVVLGATITWSADSSEDLTLWLAADEKLDCSKLVAGTRLGAFVEKVCCNPSTSVACVAGATAVVTNAKLAPPQPVKKASRSQLEAEVEKLRAENAKLRTSVFRYRRTEREELERLRRQQEKLRRTLKP